MGGMTGAQPIQLGGPSTADAGVFLNRLLRLDPDAVVRVVPGPGALVALWAHLPWRVLATTNLAGTAEADRTVAADALRDWLGGSQGSLHLSLRDPDWRWAIPPVSQIRARDHIAAADIRRVGTAAADTLTQVRASGVRGRAVGARAVRDALLDLVSITVATDEGDLPIGQRLIQGVLRMGFLGSGDPDVVVLTAGAWLGLAGPHGTVWQRPGRALVITPVRGGQKGTDHPHSQTQQNG